MTTASFQLISVTLFAIAVLHTFSTKLFEHLARTQTAHVGLWHLLGEVKNAPNPAGIAILREHFEDKTINPLGLFLAALPPTLIAGLVFNIFG